MQSYPPDGHGGGEGNVREDNRYIHIWQSADQEKIIWVIFHWNPVLKVWCQTDQSLFTDVSINYIFKGYSSLKEFNSVVGFVSESFHLNRIPLSRQS